jgi:hypothetical protein
MFDRKFDITPEMLDAGHKVAGYYIDGEPWYSIDADRAATILTELFTAMALVAGHNSVCSKTIVHIDKKNDECRSIQL